MSKKKVFIQVPPGKGKSRIIAAILLSSLLKSTVLSHAVVVFSSKFLMDTDANCFDQIRGHLVNSKKLSTCSLTCVVGLNEALKYKGKNVLFIVDEADCCLLD